MFRIESVLQPVNIHLYSRSSFILLMLLSICYIACDSQSKPESKERAKRGRIRLNEVSDFADVVEPLDQHQQQQLQQRLNLPDNTKSAVSRRNAKVTKRDHKKRRKRLYDSDTKNAAGEGVLNLNKFNFYPKSSALKFAPFVVGDVKNQRSIKLKPERRDNAGSFYTTDAPPITASPEPNTNKVVCVTSQIGETQELPFEWEDEILKEVHVDIKRDAKTKDEQREAEPPNQPCPEEEAESSPATSATGLASCEQSTEFNATYNASSNCGGGSDDDSDCSNDEEEQQDNESDDLCSTNQKANHTGCAEPEHHRKRSPKARRGDADDLQSVLENVKLSNQYLSSAVKPMSIAQETLEKLRTSTTTTTTTKETTHTGTEPETTSETAKSESVTKVTAKLVEKTKATQFQKALKETTTAFELPNEIATQSLDTFSADVSSNPNTLTTCEPSEESTFIGKLKNTLVHAQQEPERGMGMKELTTATLTNDTHGAKANASFEELEACENTTTKSAPTATTTYSLEPNDLTNLPPLTGPTKNVLNLNEMTVEAEKGMGIMDKTTSVYNMDADANANANTDQQSTKVKCDTKKHHVPKFKKRDSVFAKSLDMLKRKLDMDDINDVSEVPTNSEEEVHKKMKRLQRDLRLINVLESLVDAKVNVLNESPVGISFKGQGHDRSKRFLFGKTKKKSKKKKVWKKLYSRDFVSKKKGRFLNHGRQNSP